MKYILIALILTLASCGNSASIESKGLDSVQVDSLVIDSLK